MSLVLDINKSIFTKNFFRVKDSKARYLWLYGGSGSSKTFSVAQFLNLETYQERAKGRTIYVIKHNASKMQATLVNDFFNPDGGGIIDNWGLREHFKFNKTEKLLTNTLTGVSIKFMGVDNPEAIKGLTAPHIVFVDEISDFPDSKVYDQLLKRVRIEGARFIFCFNPIDEKHWIKTQVFDIPQNNREIIQTTYKDNKSVISGDYFIDQNYIEYLENLQYTDYNAYRIYALGEFGKEVPKSGRFYKMFDVNHHVTEGNEHIPDESLHITFDFNVNPYVTLCIWQKVGNSITQIDEICAKSPNNSTHGVCKLFREKYNSHTCKVYYYGDPSGYANDTRTERDTNDYTIIEHTLGKHFDLNRRTSRSAEKIEKRGQFINAIFAGEIKTASIRVDKRCVETIEDYTMLLEDKDGKKHKAKIKDENGVLFEQYGHTSDANDYFLCAYYSEEMRIFKRGSQSHKYKPIMGR